MTPVCVLLSFPSFHCGHARTDGWIGNYSRQHVPHTAPASTETQDLEELRGWIILEEAPATVAAANGAQHGRHNEEEEETVVGRSLPPPHQHHQQALRPPGGLSLLEGETGEEEPIRVRKTVDPLVLHVWFGATGAGAAVMGPVGAPGGPPGYAVRVPRFYPHSVRVFACMLNVCVCLHVWCLNNRASSSSSIRHLLNLSFMHPPIQHTHGKKTGPRRDRPPPPPAAARPSSLLACGG